ncbi:MAG: Ig-like domain-containing protein [Gemmatimonadetes bacterium]|nr:Ig-like domain-containing protein [Gemmatimonadota bacterium]
MSRVGRVRQAMVLGSAVLVLGVSACASPGIPPGGPPDKEPPQLIRVTPDTNSVNVRARSIVFRFDEVVNERSTPLTSGSGGNGGGGGGSGSAFASSSNASSLASLVSVSPGDGRERVTWRRDAIEIEPRNGFRPNTTYRVTILPGLGDLRSNILRVPVELVFSTGPQPTRSTISGLIFDWVGNKTAPGARIEVFSRADSLLRWSARADSTGRFTVRDLAPGTYALRGWLDANADRTIDPRELLDSTTITVDSTVTTELYAFAHDTIGPRIETLEPIDSTALRIKFDRGVDVAWSPDSSTLVIMRNDSSYVRIGVMIPASRFDSLATAARAAADSAAPPADSAAPASAGRPARADTSRAPRPVQIAPGARFSLARPGAVVDTVPPPKLNRPIPIQAWVVRYDAPLPPGDYRLKVRAIRGLTGVVRASEREFKLRPPAVPRDSSATTKPAVPAAPAAPAKPDVRRPRW